MPYHYLHNKLSIMKTEDMTLEEQLDWAAWYSDPVKYEHLDELERIELIKYSKQ